MNSTIIADLNYIIEINAHILGIVNKTDKFFQKNIELFKKITFPCFLQAMEQIESMKDKTTINGSIIEFDTMYYNKTGVITEVDKYIIAMVHKTVNLYLSLHSPEIFMIPFCYDKETNKHYAKVWLDEE